jgi:hypothetical protein
MLLGDAMRMWAQSRGLKLTFVYDPGPAGWRLDLTTVLCSDVCAHSCNVVAIQDHPG